MHWNIVHSPLILKWTASSEFGTYRLCEQRRFRRACASAQSRQNLRCSLIQAVSQEEPSDRKPDPWPLWMAGHAQLKICHDGMLEDTNSLDGAHLWMYNMTQHNKIKQNDETALNRCRCRLENVTEIIEILRDEKKKTKQKISDEL